MEEHFQVRPHFRQVVCTLQLHDTLDNRQHPGRNPRNVRDILIHRHTGNLFHLFFKVAQQGNLLFRHTDQVDQRIDVFNQDGRKVAHQAMLQVIVRCMASPKNQGSARKNTAFRILLQVKSHRITATSIVQVLQTILADRDELALVVRCSRRLGVPYHLSRPQHILFAMTHTVYISLDLFVSLDGNALLEILIILNILVLMFLSPLSTSRFGNQLLENFILNSFRLSSILGDRLLAILEKCSYEFCFIHIITFMCFIVQK